MVAVCCLAAPLACPAQTDDCAAAPLMTFTNYPGCGMAWVHNLSNATFAARTVSANVAAPTCSTTAPRDTWYRFVVPAGITSLGFHAFNSGFIPILAQGARPCLAVYRGTDCNNLTLLGCFVTSNQAFMQNGYLLFRQVSGLVPGEVIYLRVWDYNNRNYGLAVAVSYQTTQFAHDNCLAPQQLGTNGCNIFATGGDVPAPGDPPCPNWTVMDNSMFFNFSVTATTPQPVTITAISTSCTGTPFASLQLAVYNWNGTNCTGIGGSGATYRGCATGTGNVTWSGNLPVGNYMLVMDGESGFGSSLCSFGFASPVIPLPLEHVALSGWAHTGHNELRWQTTLPVPVVAYEVARSTDGHTFVPLARVAPTRPLVFRDTELEPTQRAYLYRILATDPEGGVHVSNTIQLMAQPQPFSLYPTLASQGFTRLYHGGDAETEAQVRLVALTGQVVRLWGWSHPLLPGAVQHLDLQGLPAGVYSLEVASPATGTRNFRVVIP